MHLRFEQFLGDVADIVDFGHRYYSIPAEVGVDYYRLRISVADYAYALISDKVVEFVFEFGAEIVAFQTVNRTVEALFGVESNHSGALGAEMRIVVGAVKEVDNTRLL